MMSSQLFFVSIGVAVAAGIVSIFALTQFANRAAGQAPVTSASAGSSTNYFIEENITSTSSKPHLASALSYVCQRIEVATMKDWGATVGAAIQTPRTLPRMADATMTLVLHPEKDNQITYQTSDGASGDFDLTDMIDSDTYLYQATYDPDMWTRPGSQTNPYGMMLVFDRRAGRAIWLDTTKTTAVGGPSDNLLRAGMDFYDCQ